MANVTYNNITVAPGEGAYDKSLTISATENKGREARTAYFTAKGTGDDANVKSPNAVTVIQAGHERFITQTTFPKIIQAAGEEGVEVKFRSNLESLRIMISEETEDMIVSVTVNGESVSLDEILSSYTVEGNPGKTSDYEISIVLDIPASNDTREISFEVGEMLGSPENEVKAAVTIQQTGTAKVMYFEMRGNDISPTSDNPLTVYIESDGDSFMSFYNSIYVVTSVDTIEWTATPGDSTSS